MENIRKSASARQALASVLVDGVRVFGVDDSGWPVCEFDVSAASLGVTTLVAGRPLRPGASVTAIVGRTNVAEELWRYVFPSPEPAEVVSMRAFRIEVAQ